MEQNKELKIAIIVGVIMITTCLLIFIFINSSKVKTEQQLDMQVLKLYTTMEDGKTKLEYRPCTINTDDLISVNNQFEKIFKIPAEQKKMGIKINGDYKIQSGDYFIAFDATKDKNIVYRSDLPGIFEYNGDIYDIVKRVCK